ncbi:hypothetical protein BDF14DRAFT_1750777 [Spinellus fusiger]|nr:hypothetical protein BDF14DRAFT_1750777 [Spinellus fusiger]
MASTQHISSNHLSLPHINIPSNASTRSHTPSLLSNSYQNLQASVLNSLYAPQLQGTSPEEWTIEQVAIWLDIIGFSTVAYTFKGTVEKHTPLQNKIRQ